MGPPDYLGYKMAKNIKDTMHDFFASVVTTRDAGKIPNADLLFSGNKVEELPLQAVRETT